MSWLSHKADLPAFSRGNPGRGTSVRLAFASAERRWEEHFDVLNILADILESRSLKFERGENFLELENGLVVRPQFVLLQPQDHGYLTTSTTIELNHPTLCPDGTFEFQHAIETNAEDALREGFIGWAKMDLPVFLDALAERPESCMAGTIEGVRDEASTAHNRQVLFGPPFQCITTELSDTPDVSNGNGNESHPFCPCCLLTNCLEAFQEQLQSDRFFGIRLYAARDAEGVPKADCRINGVNWPRGALALRKYVASWPDRGFEFRKQYVGIRTLAR